MEIRGGGSKTMCSSSNNNNKVVHFLSAMLYIYISMCWLFVKLCDGVYMVGENKYVAWSGFGTCVCGGLD